MTTVGFMTADFLVDHSTVDAYTVSDIPSIGTSYDSLFSSFYTWRSGSTIQQCIASLNTTSYVKAHLSTLINNIWTLSYQQLLTAYDTEVASVNADANLDSGQKVLLKTVIAVGYHSTQLWDNWFADNGNTVGRKSGSINYLDTTTRRSILESDLIGAGWGALSVGVVEGVVGGIGGTAAGAVITGGPGAPVGAALGAAQGFLRGAITGAIGGAIAGSLWDGFIKPSLDGPAPETHTPGSGGNKGKKRTG